MGRWICLIALVLAGVGAPARAQPPRIIGMVLDLTGPVFLRPAGAAPPVLLDPAKDAARAVLEGEAIRSGPGGRARVVIAADPAVTIDETKGWVVFSQQRPLSVDAQNRLRALNAYGRPGGTRGIGARVFSPADQSNVRLEALEVQWSPRAEERLLSVELRDAPGRVIWSTNGVAAASGQLDLRATAALRAALRRAEGRDAGRDEWVIAVRADSGGVGTTTFHTLAPGAARDLQIALGDAAAERDALMRAILRAHAFSTLALYNDAADEFDRALVARPRSETLLRATLAAHVHTGNAVRIRELTDRLNAAGR